MGHHNRLSRNTMPAAEGHSGEDSINLSRCYEISSDCMQLARLADRAVRSVCGSVPGELLSGHLMGRGFEVVSPRERVRLHGQSLEASWLARGLVQYLVTVSRDWGY